MAEQSEKGEKETRKAWEEVGQQFSDVGQRIGEHYRKLEGETKTSAAQRQNFNDAIKKVVDELDHAFTGLGNALRDPQTKESLNKAAKSFGEALDSTLSGLGQRMRRSSRKGPPGDTRHGQPRDKPPA